MIMTCQADPAACRDDGPWGGHHLSDRRRAGATQHWRGWRDAVCTRQGTNDWLDLRHPRLAGGRARVWHHGSLMLQDGEVLRLHEEARVLAGSFGVVAVEVLGGLEVIEDPRPRRREPVAAGTTPCSVDVLGDRCHSGGYGHEMHWIHGMRIAERPWGWRDGGVRRVEADGWIDVRYLHEVGGARSWHHRDLTRQLPSGTPVQVHEQYQALAGPAGLLTAAVAAGLGPVPEPAEPQLWAVEATVVVHDNATGQNVLSGRWDAETAPPS